MRVFGNLLFAKPTHLGDLNLNLNQNKSWFEIHFFVLEKLRIVLHADIMKRTIFLKIRSCGGKGTEVTVPTNTVQVPITTGTVTDSGSECTGFIG